MEEQLNKIDYFVRLIQISRRFFIYACCLVKLIGSGFNIASFQSYFANFAYLLYVIFEQMKIFWSKNFFAWGEMTFSTRKFHFYLIAFEELESWEALFSNENFLNLRWILFLHCSHQHSTRSHFLRYFNHQW